MKFKVHTLLFVASLQVSLSSAQLRLPSFLSKSLKLAAKIQQPMMDIPIPLPDFSGKGNDESSKEAEDLSISDVIGKERAINIFASFTRDIANISARLDDPKAQTTVLAPLNSALQKLPRKPWEDPKDYDALGTEAYEGQGGEDRATRNLRRFVEAHTVPTSPWKEGEKVESLRGEKLWWEESHGKKVVQPGDIEVDSVASKVGNGEVWVLKGCLNYV